MAAMGSGYDLGVTTFSPDGRVFQVDYACKAAESSVGGISVCCSDGVVFGMERAVNSPMVLRHRTNRRIYAVDSHIGMLVTGFLADGRRLVARARAEAESYRQYFCEPISVEVLSSRMALFMHAHTLYWSARPFGCSVLIAGVEEGAKEETEEVFMKEEGKHIQFEHLQGELYSLNPDGSVYKYAAHAVGKNKEAAKTELEKLDLHALTCEQAMHKIANIIHTQHSESDIDIEFGTISKKHGYKSVSPQKATQISKDAKIAIQQQLQT